MNPLEPLTEAVLHNLTPDQLRAKIIELQTFRTSSQASQAAYRAGVTVEEGKVEEVNEFDKLFEE